MACEYQLRRRVEFVDTDMAGIVHFSNFFRWMEHAEHAFFRSLGFSLHNQGAEEMSGWARVRAGCDYKAPLRYQDLVEVQLRVVAKGATTLSYELVFFRIDSTELCAPEDARGKLQEVARGEMKTCFVTRPGGEAIRAKKIPPEIDEAIQVAQQTL